MIWWKPIWKLRGLLLALLGHRTMGARALLIKDNKILLIKQTYTPGWRTVGGAIDRGETPLEAVKRELYEEVGAILNTPPKLFGVYHHIHYWMDDYVVFYICDDFELKEVESDEIAEIGWFGFDELPQDITERTKNRIEEYLGHKPISDRW
jgi:8-oxo-dGTP pyrophosphatase MutT (NUDIX family)